MGVCSSSFSASISTTEPQKPTEAPTANTTASSSPPELVKPVKSDQSSITHTRTLSGTIFAGTFNINASPLTPIDVKNYLIKNNATNASLICLAFQECGSAPRNPIPIPSNLIASPRLPDSPANGFSSSEFVRSKESENAVNDKFLSTISDGIGGGYDLIADVALGESPTFGKIEIRGTMTEWYGYIRLIVYLKSSDGSKDISGASQQKQRQRQRLSIKSVVSPVGEKMSAFNLTNYREGKSVDKGAVGIYIEEYDLSILSLHLMGTNVYKVAENVFDEERKKQMLIIEDSFDKVLGGAVFEKSKKIIMGDFNFRCEMYTREEDKTKGGNDWVSVVKEVERGKLDPNALRTLFDKYERLSRWMKDTDDDPLKAKFIKTCNDVIGMPKFQLISPTFTFKIGSDEEQSLQIEKGEGRRYAEKRTPSWTDRILASKGDFEILAAGKCEDVVISDHEPVFCLMKMAKVE